MKKKYIKYDEIFDNTLKMWIEKYFKESYRRGWFIKDIFYSISEQKWSIKWERKLYS